MLIGAYMGFLFVYKLKKGCASIYEHTQNAQNKVLTLLDTSFILALVNMTERKKITKW